MYYRIVYYNLQCKNCNTDRLNGQTTLESNINPSFLNNDEITAELENFENISCDQCQVIGKWSVKKVSLTDDTTILNTFNLRITKENNALTSNFNNDTNYSKEQLERIYMSIRGVVEQLKGKYIDDRNNGTASFKVELLNDEPFYRINEYEVDAISINELKMQLDIISGNDTVCGISNELNIKLENAFEDLKANTENPLVIAHLQSRDKEVNFYLLAKVPQSALYYGIMETEFTQQRMIEGIPLVNFEPYDLTEVKLIPFRTKAFISDGVKENN